MGAEQHMWGKTGNIGRTVPAKSEASRDMVQLQVPISVALPYALCSNYRNAYFEHTRRNAVFSHSLKP